MRVNRPHMCKEANTICWGECCPGAKEFGFHLPKPQEVVDEESRNTINLLRSQIVSLESENAHLRKVNQFIMTANENTMKKMLKDAVSEAIDASDFNKYFRWEDDLDYKC